MTGAVQKVTVIIETFDDRHGDVTRTFVLQPGPSDLDVRVKRDFEHDDSGISDWHKVIEAPPETVDIQIHGDAVRVSGTVQVERP